MKVGCHCNTLFVTLYMVKTEALGVNALHQHCAKDEEEYRQRQLAIRDVMELLSGKWKIQIIGTLRFRGKMRFMDLQREVDGIGAKMLSKELQSLEQHQLVTRTVKQTKPVTVEYEMTEYGKTLDGIVCNVVEWGTTHRRKMMQ